MGQLDIQRGISMCARHCAKFRRLAQFAASESDRQAYLERADLWAGKRDALSSIWEMREAVSQKG